MNRKTARLVWVTMALLAVVSFIFRLGHQPTATALTTASIVLAMVALANVICRWIEKGDKR